VTSPPPELDPLDEEPELDPPEDDPEPELDVIPPELVPVFGTE
jgi:hypothetical protein